jgi:hypothetical protein
VLERQTSFQWIAVLQVRGESSRIAVTNRIVHISRLATPLFLEFIVARSLARIIRPEMESSDRRVRDTDETLL